MLGFSASQGLRLRALVDDEERFCDGSPVVPDWGRIVAEDTPNTIYVTGDGGTSLLEGRVGPKRHTILRANPEEESLLGRLSVTIFTTHR